MSPAAGRAGAYDRFVGVDYSGARGPRLKGLRVAIASAGSRSVRLVENPAGGLWRRSDLFAWLVKLARDGRRTLVGMDLAFAFPFVDRGAYFPGLRNGPDDARALWRLVDERCEGVGEYYAGPVYLDESSPLRRYFLVGSYRGDRFEGRTRVMEEWSRSVKGANPTTVFNLVGPATVGVGSLSGMRLAAALERELGDAMAVWPFDQPAQKASLTLTEIFPRLYYLRVGARARAWQDETEFRNVLRAYGSGFRGRVDSEDVGDAVISAAALRDLASDPGVWAGPRRAPHAATKEGWILGAAQTS